MCRLVTSRKCRPLVVLAALALAACPFRFKYNVGNGAEEAVALRAGDGNVATVSAGERPVLEAKARRPPGG